VAKEPKDTRRRLKNRLSARKSALEKKELIRDLTSQNKDLTSQNRELTSQNRDLTSQKRSINGRWGHPFPVRIKYKIYNITKIQNVRYHILYFTI
jgi:hypothetical protein